MHPIKCGLIVSLVYLTNFYGSCVHFNPRTRHEIACPEGCRCRSTSGQLPHHLIQSARPCLSCRQGFLLQVNGTCIPQCSTGSVFINQSCEPCPDNCARCKDRNTCLECHEPALLAARGKCYLLSDITKRNSKPNRVGNLKPSPKYSSSLQPLSLHLLVSMGQSIEFWPFTSQVEAAIRTRINLSVTLTVVPNHGKLILIQPHNYYERKVLRQGDVLDLAVFQQCRFVYQHDSSSLQHGEDLASLFLSSDIDRSSPFLLLYHIIFVVVAETPTTTPTVTINHTNTLAQQDSPSQVAQPTLRVVEGGSLVISKDNLRVPVAAGDIDENRLMYVLVGQPKFGTLRIDGIALQNGDSLSYPDLIGGKVKYGSISGVGPLPLEESISWDVTLIKSDDKTSADGPAVISRGRTMDANGSKIVSTPRTTSSLIKRLNSKDAASKSVSLPVASQKLVLVIEPRNSSLSSVIINGELTVDEGGIEILSPDIISVNVSDDQIQKLKVVLDSHPSFGHLEVRDKTGTRKIALASSFPLAALLEEQLSYVQSQHRHVEPRSDAFRFYITDGVNRSPSIELPIIIDDVNDEPPQVSTYPLVMSPVQNSILLTTDYVLIEDEDTETSDLLLTLTKGPSHGRLQKYDELSNRHETLQVGNVFYYQDILEGDITYASSTKIEYQDEIRLQVSDGDLNEEALVKIIRKGDDNVQEYATTVPLTETINTSTTDPDTCLMEFRQPLISVEENATFAQIPVSRSGELAVTCSVICSTRSGSATSSDYDERPPVESSRIFFLRGVTSTLCSIRLHDDSFHENDEQFWVKLSQAQIEYGDSNSTVKTKRAAIGTVKELDVRIRDDEDITRIEFNQSAYHVSQSPSNSSNSSTVSIYLVRSGDLRFHSKVTVATKDGSAKANHDYLPLSRSVEFKPDETKASVELTLFIRSDWAKNFIIIMDPNSLTNAQLGSVNTATISVPPILSLGPAVLPSEPFVVSLMHFDQVGSSLNKSIPAGYPVVCVTPCDPKYPHFNLTRKFCQDMGIDVSKIRFSWEVSPPVINRNVPPDQFTLGTEYNAGSFRKLSQSTMFSSVEERVLDAVFFGPNFRIRCIAQPLTITSSADDEPIITAGTASRSRIVTISANGSPCPPFNPSVSGGQQPFKAVLSYVNSSDPLHPDTMKIQVQLPHYDGMIPILSTSPLHAIRYVLSEPVYRSHHQCSNLHPGFGFLDETTPREAKRKYPYEFSKSLRQDSAIRLYRYLDFNTCLWNFEAWYKMSELIELCGGQVVTNTKVMIRGETMVTVRVPLYVATVTTGPALDWSYVEHRTDMEFSFSYTAVLWHHGVESKLALAATPHVTRIHSDLNGRLIVEFQTETRFPGRYLLHHPTDPSLRTQLVAPTSLPHLGFHVELTWTQTNYAGCIQKWRAISNYTLQDYTGIYTLWLLPCLRKEYDETETQDQCRPLDMVNVTFPIHYQQPYRPQPVRYSLETTFQLTNNVRAFLRQPRSIEDIKSADLVDSFRTGESVYGRVLWNPTHNLSPGYRLRIEKLYLCAGRDGYIPVFDPSSEQLQYGCLENSPHLRYRLLLLDREDPHACDRVIQGIPLEVNFASQVEQLRSINQIPSMDGFVLNVDPLFQLDAGIRWFLQVSYSVQPAGSARWKRQETDASPSEKRHGTNIRLLRLAWPDSSNRSGPAMSTSQTLISTLIAVALLLMLVTTALVFIFVYYRQPSRKRKAQRAEVQQEADIPMKALLTTSSDTDDSRRATLVAEESTLI